MELKTTKKGGKKLKSFCKNKNKKKHKKLIESKSKTNPESINPIYRKNVQMNTKCT